MNFKIGQRVRFVGGPTKAGRRFYDEAKAVGLEGVITRAGNIFDWVVRYDSLYYPGGTLLPNEGFADSCQLAPLTDPKADEFMERIKNLKPYEEPVAPAVVFERMAEYERIRR